MSGQDLIADYLAYTADTEVPAVFNRWALLASIGALLGRRCYFEHGHFRVNPNMYTMLIGTPGTRKSTAIKLIKKLIRQAGYDTIAADKTTKEKFMLDLAGEDVEASVENFLSQQIFGESDGTDREMFIMADEFNDFFGNNNIEFISLLGNLWDYEGKFSNRIKGGKSVSINNPTISILGGNTPTNLAMAFPPEILGQGFFTRLLFIYGEPNGKRFAFPRPPNSEDTRRIVESLSKLRSSSPGAITSSAAGHKLLEAIYTQQSIIEDPRFDNYSTRRFTHLLKLCILIARARQANSIGEGDVIYANTTLTHAELFMPKALGQFGKSKNSDITHKVLEYVNNNVPNLTTFKDLWKALSTDMDSPSGLADILSNLQQAEKIFITGTGNSRGFLPVKKAIDSSKNPYVDFSLLTPEELAMKR